MPQANHALVTLDPASLSDQLQNSMPVVIAQLAHPLDQHHELLIMLIMHMSQQFMRACNYCNVQGDDVPDSTSILLDCRGTLYIPTQLRRHVILLHQTSMTAWNLHCWYT